MNDASTEDDEWEEWNDPGSLNDETDNDPPFGVGILALLAATVAIIGIIVLFIYIALQIHAMFGLLGLGVVLTVGGIVGVLTAGFLTLAAQ